MQTVVRVFGMVIQANEEREIIMDERLQQDLEGFIAAFFPLRTHDTFGIWGRELVSVCGCTETNPEVGTRRRSGERVSIIFSTFSFK